MTNIALTSLSTCLCSDWSVRSPMELSVECFHGIFCISPSPCLQFCFFILLSLQGSAHVLLSLPKTDSKAELQIYGKPLEAKTVEIPVRKSNVLILALLLESGWKKSEYLLGQNSDFITWTGVSRLSVKIQMQKEILTEANGVQCRREEKHG